MVSLGAPPPISQIPRPDSRFPPASGLSPLLNPTTNRSLLSSPSTDIAHQAPRLSPLSIAVAAPAVLPALAVAIDTQVSLGKPHAIPLFPRR